MFSSVSIGHKEVSLFYEEYKDSLPLSPLRANFTLCNVEFHPSEETFNRVFNFVLSLKDSVSSNLVSFENIIKRGAVRCYVFQFTVFISGLIIVVIGPGISAMITNWVLATKTIILFSLIGLLSYVHFSIQPKIEELLSSFDSNNEPPENFASMLAPFRIKRKKLATLCLFLVITAIILGLQTYIRHDPLVTIGLILLAAIFSYRANKSLIRFGWFYLIFYYCTTL